MNRFTTPQKPKIQSYQECKPDEQLHCKEAICVLAGFLHHGVNQTHKTFSEEYKYAKWDASFFTTSLSKALRYGFNIFTIELTNGFKALNICDRAVVEFLVKNCGLYENVKSNTDKNCPLGFCPNTNIVFRVSNENSNDRGLFDLLEKHIDQLRTEFGDFDGFCVPDGVEGGHHSEVFIPEEHHYLFWHQDVLSPSEEVVQALLDGGDDVTGDGKDEMTLDGGDDDDMSSVKKSIAF